VAAQTLYEDIYCAALSSVPASHEPALERTSFCCTLTAETHPASVLSNRSARCSICGTLPISHFTIEDA